VPAFETREGVAIYESNAIAYYGMWCVLIRVTIMYSLSVANDTLRGTSNSTSQALVLQYVNFADNEILPAVCAWVFPTLGIMPQDSKVCSIAHVIC